MTSVMLNLAHPTGGYEFMDVALAGCLFGSERHAQGRVLHDLRDVDRPDALLAWFGSAKLGACSHFQRVNELVNVFLCGEGSGSSLQILLPHTALSFAGQISLEIFCDFLNLLHGQRVDGNWRDCCIQRSPQGLRASFVFPFFCGGIFAGTWTIRQWYQSLTGSGPNSNGGLAMGIELRATTFKLSDATLAKLEALQGRFSLVCANRTQVVRLAIDLLELIAFTRGSMEEIVKGIQGLLCIAHFPIQSEFRFPAADSAAQGSAGSGLSGGEGVRPRVVSINHRANAVHEGMAYTSPSFPGRAALMESVA